MPAQYEYVGHIRGPINPEDMAHVPGTPWVITSGLRPGGQLYLINTDDFSCQEIFPDGACFERDAETYGASLTEPDRNWSPHGLDLSSGLGGRHTLLVVNHGGRESVEVFEVDVDKTEPKLTWVGAVEMPAGTWPNDVARLKEGGFVVTSSVNPDPVFLDGVAREVQGEVNGKVLEWQPREGFKELLEMNFPNGIVATPDDKWLYVGGWATKSVVRLSRGLEPVQIDSIPTGTCTDNLTWDADGYVLAAGQDGDPAAVYDSTVKVASRRFPSRIVRIDPVTLATEVVITYGEDVYGSATVGMQIGNEIWVGSYQSRGLARFERTA